MKGYSVCFAIFVWETVVLSTIASAQHSDVLVADVGGKVAVGDASNIDAPGETFDLDTRVFESILRGGFSHPTLAADYEAVEPGFFALHSVSHTSELASLGASALPGDAAVSLNLSSFSVDGDVASLFYWNGIGPVDFDPAPAGADFGFKPPGSFATTGANGDLDDHPVFQVDNGGAGAPADGVYLIAQSIDVAGLATSDRFFVVLLVDQLIDTEDDVEDLEVALEALEAGNGETAFLDGKDFAFYEAAVEYVETNIAIPEPSAGLLSLAACGLIALCRFRVVS